ncbi:hypothetical protein [Pedobacter hiemivivus]|uniref:Uncharacterized protein n=1 Tax=Pedobacter hiemivivus TaxID=2530454 RepID=A0A4R0MV74_9SPHI|nr:hypothetical protein [Pedobacter hiemivivus]TCC91040.1 hypothetical protein EZ444_20210 [Pedobacter hiemivivus]
MKISKELIEKYHRHECSAEESEAVEGWLFSGESDEALQLPISEDKAQHKAVLWNEIEKVFPQESPAPISTKKDFYKNPFWSGAIAATFVIAILGITGYYLTTVKPTNDMPLVVNNSSSMHVKHVDARAYQISVGTNTSTRINNTTGVIDLSGSLLISPKEDMELIFEGSSEKMIFKAGQTYIILKGENGVDKIIVVNEKNIMDLPPVLQKQIINEFQI